MQGIVNYAASPTPSPPPPFVPKKGEQVNQPSTKGMAEAGPSSATKPRKAISGIRKLPSTPAPPIPSSSNPAKRRRISPPPASSLSIHTSSSTPAATPHAELPENLTHTAQSALPESVLSSEPVTTAEEAGETSGWPGYNGMTDDEVFKVVSAPGGEADDWGIPDEVDPEEGSDTLKAKVANFLKLKHEKGEHINTRLLSSSAFANPHIYSKLVDFVQISEHGTNFPSNGWLTRRNIEAEMPLYGPAATATQQKAKQEAIKRAQEVGKRKEIAFAPGRSQGNGSGREVGARDRYRDDYRDDREGNRGWDSGRRAKR